MPTLIDSMILKLDLDPKGFTEGQKKAAEAVARTKDSVVKSGKETEASAVAVGNAFTKATREALGFFAILLGARGLKEFVANITVADAALGRFARNLNTSPQVISAWEMAAERMGGTAAATAGTFERMGKALFDLHQHGQMLPQDFYRLEAATGKVIDQDHGVNKFMTDLAGALHQLGQVNQSLAHFYAAGIGLDDATANFMIKYGGKGLQARIDLLKQLAPSQETIANLQKLQDTWVTLSQKVQSFGTYIVGKLVPYITPLLEQLGNWIGKNRDWIATGIVGAVRDFANWLSKIDWTTVGQGLKDFGKDAKLAADSIGGLKTALEVLFALWAGSKAAAFLTAMGRLATIATTLSGAFGLLATIPWLSPNMNPNTPANKAFEKTWKDSVTGHAGPVDHSALGNWFLKHMPSWMTGGAGGDVKVGGQPVSKANPLPVAPTGGDNTSTPDGVAADTEGGGWMSKLAGAASKAGLRMGPPGTEKTPSRGSAGWWTPEREKFAYDYLRKHANLSDAGAKAMVARMAYVEASGGPKSSNNIGGGHYGINQRSRSRAVAADYSGDFEGQLKQTAWELNNTEKAAGDRLRNAQTAREGAIGASSFERAEGYNAATHTDNWVGKTIRGMGLLGNFGGAGASGAAALSTTGATHNVTTSTQSNEIHVKELHVHGVDTNNTNDVANGITGALRRSMVPALANTGLA